MREILVYARDARHPEHEAMMNLQCDSGLDIELLPGFVVTILVPDVPASAL